MKASLTNLTKEEKLELLALLDEKARRKRQQREAYSPNAGQLPIHLSEATIRFVASANGAGKTTAAVHEVMWAATGYHPIKKRHTLVPADIGVVLDKPDKADSVWIKEIQKWFVLKPEQLHKRGKPHTTQITFDNGSTVTFFSHEQDPLTFESIQLDYVAYDEPPPEQLFVGMRRATRKKGSKPWHLIIGTPLAQAWLRRKIWEPWARGELPEAECIRMAAAVNKDNVNWEEQQKNFRFMTEQERAIRERGEFFDLSGLALAHLWRDVHYVDEAELAWEPQNPCLLVMDPHPSKAHHAIVLGVDSDSQLYVVAEYKAKVLARQFIRNLIEDEDWFGHFRIIDIVYDSLGSSETTSGEGYRSFGEVVNEELRRAELGRARATTYAEKDDEEWIERIRDTLTVQDNGLPKLRFVRGRSEGTVTDIKNVQWKQDKLKENAPKLDISHKDFLSCLKYALACNLFYDKPRRQRAHYVRKRPYGLDLGGPAAPAARKPGTMFLSRRKRSRPEADNDDW